MATSVRFLLPAALPLAVAIAGTQANARREADPGWDAKAAASYLDGRAEWWTNLEKTGDD